MRLFRIEHPQDSLGPWAHSCNGLGTRLKMNQMPTWYGDTKWEEFSINSDFNFAFKSFESFEEWVPKRDRIQLSAAGFVLAEYEVPDSHAVMATYQAVFNRTRATRVATYQLPKVSYDSTKLLHNHRLNGSARTLADVLAGESFV